jgi:hypothetical protein
MNTDLRITKLNNFSVVSRPGSGFSDAAKKLIQIPHRRQSSIDRRIAVVRPGGFYLG